MPIAPFSPFPFTFSRTIPIKKKLKREVLGGGIFATIGLGILGALVGGYIGQTLLGSSGAAAASAGALTIPSIIFAVLGAMLLIFIWGLISRSAA